MGGALPPCPEGGGAHGAPMGAHGQGLHLNWLQGKDTPLGAMGTPMWGWPRGPWPPSGRYTRERLAGGEIFTWAIPLW